MAGLEKLALQPLGAVVLGNLRVELSRYKDLLQLMFRGDAPASSPVSVPFANIFVGPDTAQNLRALADLVEAAEGVRMAAEIEGEPV